MRKLTLSLPTAGCGVRLSSVEDNPDEIYYTLILVVQQDRHLRQFTDQERIVKCRVNNSALAVKSKPMEEAFIKTLHDKPGEFR